MEPLAIVRALHLAATVAAAGAFAFRFLVLPRTQAISVEPWLRRICAWGIALALASWLSWLVLLAASMSGRPLAQAWHSDVLVTVLARTTFGHAWILRSVLFLALAAKLAWSGRKAHLDGLEAALAVAALVSVAWTGHAVGTNPWHLVSDALHLLGVGLWLGALLPLLLVLGRARGAATPAWQALAHACTRRFSALGVTAMALLVITGLVNASFLVGSLAAMASPYGQLLAAKLTLLVAILMLAAINRWRLMPSEAIKPLWRNALAELCLGAGILAIVGVLGMTEPPAHQMGGHHAPHAMHGAHIKD